MVRASVADDHDCWNDRVVICIEYADGQPSYSVAGHCLHPRQRMEVSSHGGSHLRVWDAANHAGNLQYIVRAPAAGGEKRGETLRRVYFPSLQSQNRFLSPQHKSFDEQNEALVRSSNCVTMDVATAQDIFPYASSWFSKDKLSRAIRLKY